MVRQKKLTMWKEVVEKINVDFEGSRKEFFKLEVLQKHYQHLGRVRDFDDAWKMEVESKVQACGRMSGSCEDAFR